MKTSISSKALTQFGVEKIAFPPKPDGHTDGQTDICNYRVASLLKINMYIWTFRSEFGKLSTFFLNVSGIKNAKMYKWYCL